MFNVNPDTFWSHVDRIGGEDSCWPWTGRLSTTGYGAVDTTRGGIHRTMKAHRVAYFLARGEFDARLFVCHHCDNPPCVNPAHLFLGTQRDNLMDMYSKGRGSVGERHRSRMHPETVKRGESHPNALLDEASVYEIRRRVGGGESQRVVGLDFGIGQAQVSRVVHRKQWAHV